MTNILCLKNLIRLYRVTYDSERRTAFIVHREEFGLPNMVFDMHPCGLHVYYPEKIDGQYGFVQTVADNMKLFTKQQIEGALKARPTFMKPLGIHRMRILSPCSELMALADVHLPLTMPG
jgi:hypothetical protein